MSNTRRNMTIEIILDTEYDYTIYMLYDMVTNRQKRLIGINYNCGAGDVDNAYMVPDEELTVIYTTRYKGNLNADKLTILRESIEEFNMERRKRQFEAAFEELLEKSKFNLDYRDQRERYVITDVVNMVLTKLDME